MTGLALLLVCLIPRATSLVFEYGGDVTVNQLESSILHGMGWTLAELVDLFYVGIVLAAVLLLLGLAVLVTQGQQGKEAMTMRHSKYTISAAIVLLLILSLLLPVQNRYFLLIIPVALILERDLSAALFKPGISS